MLVVADGPVDAHGRAELRAAAGCGRRGGRQSGLAAGLLPFRADLKLFTAQVQAAERVVRDSSKDRWPSLDAIFLPQSIYPTPFFSSRTAGGSCCRRAFPCSTAGSDRALKVQRQAALDVAQANLTGAITQASSQVRAAREAVASGERSLASAQAAADQAQQVVNIVNVSFRAGAATNIEVIDAERRRATPIPPSRSPRTRCAAPASISSWRSAGSRSAKRPRKSRSTRALPREVSPGIGGPPLTLDHD